MSLRVKCQKCGKTVKGGDDWAGRKAKCPNCSADIQFPHITTIVPPKQLPPPEDDWVTRPATSWQEPPVIIDTSKQEASLPEFHVKVDHKHKAAGGAFRSGFGLALGCLAAFLLMSFGGCIVILFLAAGVSNAVDQERKTAKVTPPAESEFSQRLKSDLSELQRRTQSQSEQYQNSQTQTRASGSAFTFNNVTMRSELGMLKVIGEATNNSGKDYQFATFTVTVYDKDDNLLDTGPAIVPNFAAGQTKTFEAYFLGTSSKSVVRYKIQFDTGL